MTTLPPNNSESFNIVIPGWISFIDKGNNLMKVWDLAAHTYSVCCAKRDAKLWDSYSLVQDLWLKQASDEDIFRFLRWDFESILSSTGMGVNKRDELKYRAIDFIWSKNSELQSLYPNFEWITKITEANKLWDSKSSDKPWITLQLSNLNPKGELHVYTRPNGDEWEFVMHYYAIEADGKVVHRYSLTQWEINIQYEQWKTQRAVLDSLIREASWDPLKIAQAHLAHAITLKAQYWSKK